MASEQSLYQLFYEIALLQIFVIVGILLIVSTKNRWNILLDPPAQLQILMSRVGKRLLSRKWETRGYYLVGTLLILVAGILIIQRLINLGHRLGY